MREKKNEIMLRVEEKSENIKWDGILFKYIYSELNMINKGRVGVFGIFCESLWIF